MVSTVLGVAQVVAGRVVRPAGRRNRASNPLRGITVGGMPVLHALIEKGPFASNLGPLFASDMAKVSTQMTYIDLHHMRKQRISFSYLRRTLYTVRCIWLSPAQQRRGICVAHSRRCDANHSTASHPGMCNAYVSFFF